MPSRIAKKKTGHGWKINSLTKLVGVGLLILISIVTVTKLINYFYPLLLGAEPKQNYLIDQKNRVPTATPELKPIHYPSPTQRIIITKTPSQRLAAIPPLYPKVIWHQEESETNSLYGYGKDPAPPPMNYFVSDKTSVSYTELQNYYFGKLKEPEWKITQAADAPTTDQGTIIFENDNLVYIIDGRLVSKNPSMWVHSVWHN